MWESFAPSCTDLGVLHEHVLSGNAGVGEAEESIIDVSISHLRTDVTKLDSYQG